MKRALAAAFGSAALLLGAAWAGEGAGTGAPPGPAAELRWGYPRPLVTQHGDPRYGQVFAPSPFEFAQIGDCALTITENAESRRYGQGGAAQAYIRKGDGPWQEVTGLPAGSPTGTLAAAGKEFAMLFTGQVTDRRGNQTNGRTLEITLIPADPAGKVRCADIFTPKQAKEGQRDDRAGQIPCAALAERLGTILVAFWMQKFTADDSGAELCLRSSADGGTTWKELPAAAFAKEANITDCSVTLWAGDDGFHLLYASMPEGAGNRTTTLRHSLSADGGATWKDAPAPLPQGELPAGSPKSLCSAQATANGQDVWVVAGDAPVSAGTYKTWLLHSPDGGATWAAPRKISDRKQSGMLFANCRLAVGKGVLVYGAGWRDDNGRQANECLLSRDEGASWQKLDYSSGLIGKSTAPRVLTAADGTVGVVFAWTDSKNTETALLFRSAGQVATGSSDADRAAIAALIKDLASDDWRAREKAAAGLVQWGPPALPLLREAAKDADAERSLAAEDLLRKVKPLWLKE